ncbi:transposase [bacterium]|nr:MAG: transposase [bacterium]
MWQEDLVVELNSAEPAGRKAVLGKYSILTGHSPTHLYRVAKASGFNAGRKDRMDKGMLECGLSDGQIEFVAALMYETGRENKGPIMPMERAIQIAEDNGIINAGQVSPATLNRILRERQASKRHMKNPEPHTNMRSLHPNHVHVFDVSVCVQYYLKNGKMGIMDERVFYKNKPQNAEKIKTRLLRYLVVDHFSGEFYCRYYDTTGETSANLFDFLKEAWGRKEHAKAPFRGVPFVLLMDNGAANASRAIVAMLERMGVDIPKGRPYNPQRQGAVETLHTTIEQQFESGLRIQPAFDVATLNAWAFDWMIRFKATKEHRRHGLPRTQMWLTIRPEELRELPPDEIMQEFFAKPEEECHVYADYSIRYRGMAYSVRHVGGVHPNAKVQAILKPFKLPKIDVAFNGKTYEANPIEMLPALKGGFRADAVVIGKDYKSQPETATMQAIKRFDNMAYGDDRKKASIPFESLRVFGDHASKVDGLEFLPKAGTPLELERPAQIARVPILEFFKELKRAIGIITPELNAELRTRYGESITRKEADEEIDYRRHNDVAATEAKTAVS